MLSAVHQKGMTDDEISANQRRKKYRNKLERGSSLEENGHTDHVPKSRLKSASSESQLNEAKGDGLSVPEGKRTGSKLSLLGEHFGL